MNPANSSPKTDANALVISLANTLLALCDMDREAVITLVRQQEGAKRRVVFDLGGAARFGKIELIKAVRYATGMGLAEAKGVVEGAEFPERFSNPRIVATINAEFAEGLRNRVQRTPPGSCGFYLDEDNKKITAYLASGHVPCTLV